MITITPEGVLMGFHPPGTHLVFINAAAFILQRVAATIAHEEAHAVLGIRDEPAAHAIGSTCGP